MYSGYNLAEQADGGLRKVLGNFPSGHSSCQNRIPTIIIIIKIPNRTIEEQQRTNSFLSGITLQLSAGLARYLEPSNITELASPLVRIKTIGVYFFVGVLTGIIIIVRHA